MSHKNHPNQGDLQAARELQHMFANKDLGNRRRRPARKGGNHTSPLKGTPSSGRSPLVLNTKRPSSGLSSVPAKDKKVMKPADIVTERTLREVAKDAVKPSVAPGVSSMAAGKNGPLTKKTTHSMPAGQGTRPQEPNLTPGNLPVGRLSSSSTGLAPQDSSGPILKVPEELNSVLWAFNHLQAGKKLPDIPAPQSLLDTPVRELNSQLPQSLLDTLVKEPTLEAIQNLMDTPVSELNLQAPIEPGPWCRCPPRHKPITGLDDSMFNREGNGLVYRDHKSNKPREFAADLTLLLHQEGCPVLMQARLANELASAGNSGFDAGRRETQFQVILGSAYPPAPKPSVVAKDSAPAKCPRKGLKDSMWA